MADNEDPNDTSTTPASNLVGETMADASNDPREGKRTAKRERERRALEQYNAIPNLHRAELEVLARALLNERDHLLDVVDHYEEGREFATGLEGAELTAGQLWGRLLDMSPQYRLDTLQGMIRETRECYQQDHKGRIADLRYELTDHQAKLGAVFGFDTPQTLHSLTVAAQALRNIMVAGIAERVEPVVEAEKAKVPEFRHPDLEAEKAKVRDSLKEAGIDTSAPCGYEWPGDDLHDHVCGVMNPLHAVNHSCEQCGEPLTHQDAEKLAEAGR